MTMTAAESCTGGLIAKIMTDMAGSSEVFWGGFITYSNDSKEKLIGVPAETLEHFGAVSDETVRAMAEGALKRSTADCSLAVSGIAGPGGGTAEKPVGTVWIGVALKKGTVLSRIYHFEGDRAAIRGETAKQAISMLIDLISHIDY
ncbi:nicotinamide-nucleotide amidase [Spirochaeta isovalerica]|uniref:Nicotinamide-nucleotide amidase n=2 Tax=Spirochaeta isovalerica TaxID=150 RepID=A0A841RC85_9SPIO|nr:nicotinamide-nucleotide amidase [Spirochaeta isovalerica]